ncbi:hypothetical protein KM043_007360 [Ampulex compressa]|uniref:Venom protein n=1 Tax=Ampulex compressa TaxID=860918 RepID=A0A1W6EWE7_AMPCP|nr:venom protein [Ampulex compressa]KAG7205360.1 hypothetical protein KM043_007360 [Ampulex compressa]
MGQIFLSVDARHGLAMELTPFLLVFLVLSIVVTNVPSGEAIAVAEANPEPRIRIFKRPLNRAAKRMQSGICSTVKTSGTTARDITVQTTGQVIAQTVMEAQQSNMK